MSDARSSQTAQLWARGSLRGTKRGAPELLFGQVREDAAVEVAALQMLRPGASVFGIASGGCTLLALLACAPQRLIAADINPAQVWLMELKVAIFAELSRPELLLCITSDARPAYGKLRARLSDEAQTFWDARQNRLVHGLNGCGKVDEWLRLLTRPLPFLQSARRVRRMFEFEDTASQRRFYGTAWDNFGWRLALRLLLSRFALRRVFGPEFVAALPAEFAAAMKRQLDAAFTRSPSAQNLYLWQALRGQYPPGAAGLTPYLQAENYAAIRANLPAVELVCADAVELLEAHPPNSFDFFALSNIAEAASPEFSRRLLRAVERAARPGALACLRSFFPFEMDGPQNVDHQLSQRLMQLNRSPFCGWVQVLHF